MHQGRHACPDAKEAGLSYKDRTKVGDRLKRAGLSHNDRTKLGARLTASYRDTTDDHSTATSMSVLMSDICPIIDLLRANKEPGLKLLPVALGKSEDDDYPIVANLYDKNTSLQIGDIIKSVVGKGEVLNISDLATKLRGMEDGAQLTIERQGRTIDVNVNLETHPDILRVRAINLSGIIIVEQWKLDREVFAHDNYLFVDFVKSDAPGMMINVSPGDHIIAVNGRQIKSLDQLYEYLSGLKADDDVLLINRTRSSDSSHYYEYFQATVPAGQIEWIKVE